MSDIQKFRRKPVVIEACQVVFPVDDIVLLAAWCGGKIVWGLGSQPSGISITTLEGDLRADIGDYVIKGVKGEFYAYKPDIFEATYESVSDTVVHNVFETDS